MQNNRKEEILDMDIINKRRSIRRYCSKSISDESLELLVRAGMQAPSAKNQQAWGFYVITNKENLQYISEDIPSAKFASDAAAAIIVLFNHEKEKAPNITQQDLASATTNILLKATQLEIGSCWCAVYPYEDRILAVKERFSFHENYEPFSLIVLGYPDNLEDFKFIDRYNPNVVFYDR